MTTLLLLTVGCRVRSGMGHFSRLAGWHSLHVNFGRDFVLKHHPDQDCFLLGLEGINSNSLQGGRYSIMTPLSSRREIGWVVVICGICGATVSHIAYGVYAHAVGLVPNITTVIRVDSSRGRIRMDCCMVQY
jgi:hypothetical protein